PYPADGFFAGNNYKNFDGILAMYHDQGLIPFKYIASHRGINYSRFTYCTNLSGSWNCVRYCRKEYGFSRFLQVGPVRGYKNCKAKRGTKSTTFEYIKNETIVERP